MCHATSACQKAGSVSTNKSQIKDTLSTNKAYLYVNVLGVSLCLCMFFCFFLQTDLYTSLMTVKFKDSKSIDLCFVCYKVL